MFINPKKITTVASNFGKEILSGENKKVAEIISYINERNTLSSDIVFRGVSWEFLYDRLTSNKNEVFPVNESEIARRLFYFGEKSQHFRNVAVEGNNPKWLKYYHDLSERTIIKVFDRLKGLTKSKDPNIINYVGRNESFFDFFSNNVNKEIFYKMICSEGLEARDYFISILHTAGYIGMTGRSTGVSTSLLFEQAESFTNSNIRDYIIIAVNRTSEDDVMGIKEAIVSHGVPVIIGGDSIFPKQNEVTFRAGIFPHDIIGIYSLNNSELILNPYIFSKENESVNIFDMALNIDQSKFEEEIFLKTNYVTWFYQLHFSKIFQYLG
ncbi:TPA: hypothetical protein P0E37_005086 [Vibrio campbellii]|nr:hypothetical protein [Vibrio campbellii]